MAAGLGDVQHGVDHGSEVIGVLAAALAWRYEHRLEQGTLVIGQVTWVRHAGHGFVGRWPRNTDTRGDVTTGVWRRSAAPAGFVGRCLTVSPWVGSGRPRRSSSPRWSRPTS